MLRQKGLYVLKACQQIVDLLGQLVLLMRLLAPASLLRRAMSCVLIQQIADSLGIREMDELQVRQLAIVISLY